MPGALRTIRVFVSSTFSDMKAERDVLQAGILPRLKRFVPQDVRRIYTYRPRKHSSGHEVAPWWQIGCGWYFGNMGDLTKVPYRGADSSA
jgi:hypothetical protein